MIDAGNDATSRSPPCPVHGVGETGLIHTQWNAIKQGDDNDTPTSFTTTWLQDDAKSTAGSGAWAQPSAPALSSSRPGGSRHAEGETIT